MRWINYPQSEWQGAWLATFSALIGGVGYFSIFVLPIFLGTPVNLSMLGFIVTFIVIAIQVASLLTLPFSFVGGYALAWLLRKQPANDPWINWKAIIGGMMIGGSFVAMIFAIGYSTTSCLTSHGICQMNTREYIQELLVENATNYTFLIERFMPAIFIASLSGGWTGWQLIRRR